MDPSSDGIVPVMSFPPTVAIDISKISSIYCQKIILYKRNN